MSSIDAPGSDSARILYRDLLRFGPRPRTQLAQRSGLSLPTVTRGVRELLAAGLVRELPAIHSPGGKGRPQEPIDVVEENGPSFLGLKITDTALHIAVTTVRAQELSEHEVPLSATDPDTVLDTVVRAVDELRADVPHLTGTGVSLAGHVVDRRHVGSSRMLGWTQRVELADRLEDRLGLPITVENDLRALLQGVHWFGPGRHHRTFALLTIGAGVATGIVHDDRVLAGSHFVAGLTERLVVGVEPDGTELTVGRAASTAGILARARERGVTSPDLDTLRAARRAGHPIATAVLSDAVRGVAIACGALAALVDPEVILIGGESVSMLREDEAFFLEVLRAQLSPFQADMPVRSLGEDFDTWARGAAAIAVQTFVGSSS